MKIAGKKLSEMKVKTDKGLGTTKYRTALDWS